MDPLEEEIHFRNCHYQVLPVSFQRVNAGFYHVTIWVPF